MNPYETLGVSETASEKEIKSAFRQLALKHHPDRNPNDPDAESKFKEVSQAYEILSDPELKARYDQYGSIDERDMGGFDFDFGGFGINLGDIFGFNPFNSERVVENISRTISISFMEAAKGCEKEIEIKRRKSCNICNGTGAKDGKTEKCKACNGQGKTSRVQGNMRFITTCHSCGGEGIFIKEKCSTCGGVGTINEKDTIKVKIPSGLDDGTTLRLKGKGQVNKIGRAGDLLLNIKVRPHSHFSKIGRDIKSEHSISYLDAILGGTAEIETIWGAEKIKMPAGTQPNTMMKIDKHGVDIGGRKGDHIVKINIEIPKKLTHEERKILEGLRNG